METPAEPSSHRPVIKVLPEGFIDPDRRTGSTTNFKMRGDGVAAIVSLVLFFPVGVLMVSALIFGSLFQAPSKPLTLEDKENYLAEIGRAHV